MHWALAISMLACLAGCLKDNTIVETLMPSAYVRFDPFDGATAQSGHDLLIHVEELGLVADDATLMDLAARVRLRTWPDGDPIPITGQSGNGTLPAEKVVRVMPLGTLEDRWHVLMLESLPAGFFPRTTLEDGTKGARFRPGSHPRVARIEFCAKNDLGMKVILHFSELVEPPPGGVVSIAASGRAIPCDVTDSRSDGLSFSCAELLTTSSVTLSVGSGIVATSGQTLEPATWDVAIARLPAGSCRPFTPAI